MGKLTGGVYFDNARATLDMFFQSRLVHCNKTVS